MAEGKTKAPPADGKRQAHLAQLEAGVSALALALAANGIELEEGQQPIEQAIAIVKRWKELTLGRAELLLNVALAVGVEPDTIEDPFAAAAGALETMKARIGELEAADRPSAEEVNDGAVRELKKRVLELEIELAETQIDLEDVTNAKNALANQLSDEGRGQGEQPAAELEPPAPEPVVRERPEAARDVGPAFGKLTYAELQEVISSGQHGFEVAFSNGDFEILEFTPSDTVTPDKLVKVDSSRFILGQSIALKGGDHPEQIHGAGLLLEGEQLAYCTFDPPLTVQPGHEWKFDRTLIFG